MRLKIKLDICPIKEILIAIVMGISFFQPQLAKAESIDVGYLNEVTHLEISNVSPADYSIKKEDNRVVIVIEGQNPKELEKLAKYSDRFIQKIEIGKNSSLSKDIVSIYLTDKKLDIFDYLTDAPAALSIDIFTKEDSKEGDVEYEMAQKLRKKEKKENAKNIDFKVENVGRGIASDEFIKSIGHVTIAGDTQPVKKEIENEEERKKKKREINKELQRIMRLAKMDEADILKFNADAIHFSKDSLIEGRNRIYIKFPTLLAEKNYISEVLQKNVQYEFKKSEDPVTLDFLKVKKFYNNSDYKNFLKAKKIYALKHPGSKFEEMLTHMEGETYLNIYNEEKDKLFFDKALKIYDGLLSRYPGSPVAERTLLLVSYLRLKDQNYFDGARNLKSYIERYPKSPLRENIELTLAQALIRLKEFKDAKEIYARLSKSESSDIKAAAFFEVGDAYFEQRDYQNARMSYEKALQLFPTDDKNHENIYFNLSEVEFLLGDYKKCLNYLRKFIEQHPQHEYAAYAWTRMGEIFEMSDVSEKIWKGYFNESYFRFQNKAGGMVAKINLMYHQALKEAGDKFSYVVDQMRAFENKIPLPQANEYLYFKISDVYFEHGDFKKSYEMLINYFKNGDIPEHAEKFHKRIGRSLASELKSDIENHKMVEGMQLFDDIDPLWFKKSERFDFSYYQAELFREAHLCQKALPNYEKFLLDLAAVKDPFELDKSQRVPKEPEVRLHYVDCLLADTNSKKANEEFNKINFSQLEKDSHDLYYYTQATLLAKNDKIEEALISFEKIEKPSYSQAIRFLEITKNIGLYASALKIIDSSLEKRKFSDEERFALLKEKISLLESSKNKNFKDFLARFYNEYKDKKMEFNREKYLYYQYLMQNKKTKEADDVFSRIDADSYWAKLAKETQKNENWEQKYQKYIDRIPAMKGEKGK